VNINHIRTRLEELQSQLAAQEALETLSPHELHRIHTQLNELASQIEVYLNTHPIIINCLRAQQHVITIEHNAERHKIFQINFPRKNEESIYIALPYFEHPESILSLVTLPKEQRHIPEISLEPGGKVSTHQVKYAHHISGEAHFSQPGKIRTEVRKQSIPLHQPQGHLFTIMLQCLTAFEPADPLKDSKTTRKRTAITFSFDSKRLEAVKIVGRLWLLDDIKLRVEGETSDRTVVGPILPLQVDPEKLALGFLLSAPYDSPAGKLGLFLTCEEIPQFDKKHEASFIFLGGFDDPDTVNDLSKETTFLTLSSPIDDISQLKKAIGCVDYM
jgi:hypothetical protein